MIRVLASIIAVLTLLGGVQTYRLDRTKAQLVVAQRDLKTANDLATELANVGQADAERQAEQCTARVAQARHSAQRIESLLQREVPRDPTGCPVRALLGSSELSDALAP